MQLYKSDLYLIPRAKEAACKAKYDQYLEKLQKFDYYAKMFEYKIDGDEENLLKTKHGYDEGRHSELNGETQKLAKKGFEV